jgi:hypothetical protein
MSGDSWGRLYRHAINTQDDLHDVHSGTLTIEHTHGCDGWCLLLVCGVDLQDGAECIAEEE